ncbi:HAMP domain-containing protein, partial [Streptomyces sp. NPDC002586]
MRPPIASLVVLLLVVAALTVIGLDGIQSEPIPQAVLNGEQQIAADTALSVRTAIDVESSTVRRTAAAYPATSTSTPATALKALTSARKAVLGSALLDPHTGRLLAAGGKPVPLAGVDVPGTASGHGAIPPRLVTSGGTRQLLYFARVTLPAQQEDANQDQNQVPGRPDRQWLLVVSETLPVLTTYGDGRGAAVLDANGTALATTASGMASPAAADSGLPAAASRAARESGRDTDASGSLLGAATGS